ncbi:uncharacterized protein LOC134819219 [Bolinopsis microptera]|uniref:uncharacterized protein LOC134819219 n=1 Tax=Bolinopsis microptera TaxID=2820187 RepID=UPI003078FB00
MEDTHNGRGHHKNSLHDITMGHPNQPDRPSTFSADKKPNMASSNYLKSFMVEESSDEDSPPPTKPKNSFFYKDQTTEDDVFPQHPAKRKRTSSNSSNSDSETRPPLRQYSRNSSARSSRNNSEKSAKSGTVCGTYGSVAERSCYRPKFPTDDSDDNKDKTNSSRSPVNRSSTGNGTFSTDRSCSNGTPRFKATYQRSTDRPSTYGADRPSTYGTDRVTPHHPKFPSDSSEEGGDVKSPAPSSPKVEIKSEESDKDGASNPQTDEQTNVQSREPSLEPVPRGRLGRTAAVKAQDLIKSFGPKQYRTKEHRLADSEDDYCSDSSYDCGVPKYKLDPTLLKTLPQSLQIGYKFYAQLRNDPVFKQDLVPFLDPVDSSHEGTKDYYKKIEKPMCLTKIEEKMSNLDYFSTPEIIGDIRSIFENCYRYNGFESWISKHACKVEMSLEQRITLLPYSLRAKCAMSETNPHLTLYRDVCGRRTRVPRVFTGCSKSPIMLAMEEMTLYRSKEAEIIEAQLSHRREAQLQERIVTLASLATNCPDYKRICNSWELISSCLMICVCQEAFNLPFTVGGLELGLLYPRHSQYLAKLMINLSSSGKKTKELEKQGKVSYEEWNREIARRVHYWYTVSNKHGPRHAQTRTGVTPEMHGIFGTHQSPLRTPRENPNTSSEVIKAVAEGKLFHELSIGERLTLLNTLCASKVTMSTVLQNCFLEYDAESLRPTTLGRDGLGNLYFHFPLWPEEVRVYVELSSAANEGPGKVMCVARSTDELESIIEQLQTSGKVDRLEEHCKKGGRKRVLVTAAKFLVIQLRCLHEEQKPHQSHHLLVESTIYKELAQAMRDEDNLEVVQAPPTPPRPQTPPPRPQTPPPHNSESDKPAELDKDCGSESDTEVEMSEEGVTSGVESDRAGHVHSSDSEIKPNSNSGLKVEPDGVIMASNTQTETMISSTSKTFPEKSEVSDSNPSDQTETRNEAASD